ncbi:MAG TPA: ferritin family protein [Verrucomicrobiae bacterium]|nr:ferritin family protein [Verrucomicrobiae bacterium]
MDVLDFALKMETDGKAYYQQLADKATVPGLKTIFTMLAEDEQKHYDIFQAMKERTPAGVREAPAADRARSVFEGLVAEDDFQKRAVVANDIPTEAYEHGMRMEDESIRMYVDMMNKTQDEGARRVIARIIEEEKKHYNVLENIYDFVLRPHYFLQWREFTNLTELM